MKRLNEENLNKILKSKNFNIHSISKKIITENLKNINTPNSKLFFLNQSILDTFKKKKIISEYKFLKISKIKKVLYIELYLKINKVDILLFFLINKHKKKVFLYFDNKVLYLDSKIFKNLFFYYIKKNKKKLNGNLTIETKSKFQIPEGFQKKKYILKKNLSNNIFQNINDFNKKKIFKIYKNIFFEKKFLLKNFYNFFNYHFYEKNNYFFITNDNKTNKIIKNSFINQNKLESKYNIIYKKSQNLINNKIYSDYIKFIHQLKKFKSVDIQEEKIVILNKKILKNEIEKILNIKTIFHNNLIINFLFNFFPKVKIDLKKIWKWKKINKSKMINLESFLNLFPSDFQDLYFWLSLRNNREAIFALTIYHLNSPSVDIQSYLKFTDANKFPLVFQASLNALSGNHSNSKIGYLKEKKGPKTFVNYIMNNALLLLNKRKIKKPIYSLGLDHIAHDNNNKRAIQFVRTAIDTNLISHYTIDPNFLLYKYYFNKKKQYLYKISNYIKNIIHLKKFYFYNANSIELCLTPFEYADSKKIFKFTNKEIIKYLIYTNKLLFKKKVYEFFRPNIFATYLGTTHHGKDKGKPKVEESRNQKKYFSKINFISNTLHGTTGTKQNIINKSTVGCHKINIAGDLLKVFFDNLPKKIVSKIYNKKEFNQNDFKHNFYKIKHEISKLEKKNVNKISKSFNKKLHVYKKISKINFGDLEIYQKNINLNNVQKNEISKSIKKSFYSQ